MFKSIMKKWIGLTLDRSLPPPSRCERLFLAELRARCRELPALEIADAPASETTWLSNMNRLRELILTRDPREFLRWDIVSGTMFVPSADYLSTELKYLKHRSDWNARWRDAIRESSVGRPPPYTFYPSSSGNLIHHAYHLARLEEVTGLRAHEMDFVLEFGGGYGSMCRLFHNLGFHGRYLIFDLPVSSALQIYYLSTLGLPLQSASGLMSATTGVACISGLEELHDTLTGTALPPDSMFVATWSISESPIRVRDIVLSLVSGFRSFLISYQYRFGEVDNVDFFARWQETVRNVEWHSREIEHIPGNKYLMGRTRTMADEQS